MVRAQSSPHVGEGRFEQNGDGSSQVMECTLYGAATIAGAELEERNVIAPNVGEISVQYVFTSSYEEPFIVVE